MKQATPITSIEPGNAAAGECALILDTLADVALLSPEDICQLMRNSQSWLFAAVRKGEFPQPVIRQHRCTRWRASTVREHLMKVFEVAKEGTK